MTEKDFAKEWVGKIKEGMLKQFPDDFVTESETESVSLPGKLLIMGPEMFGAYEVTDSSGNPYYQSTDVNRIKYVLYANRNKPVKIDIPKDDSIILNAVKNYEKMLDSIIIEMEKSFKSSFPDSRNFLSVSNSVFNSLNLQRY